MPKWLICLFVDFTSRKTRDEALLQTEELNQLQAMQKAEEIHQFRQYRARVLSIRDIDQEERTKLKDEVLDMYGEMRVSLKVHTWISGDNPFVIFKSNQNHTITEQKEV